MDSPHWNGEDYRDFGPDYDAERCPDCHANADEDCTKDCACQSCQRRVPLVELLLKAANLAVSEGKTAVADDLIRLMKDAA